MSDKITITPIGTCRINTPLRRAAKHYPLSINGERVYGFTHTSDEAVQQLRFLQGEKDFDERSIPVLFRPGKDYRDAPHEAWKHSDLTVIEISSAKKITALGDSLQLNYLYRMFPSFFARKDTASRFWSLSRQSDREAVRAFLDEQESFRRLDKDAQALISSLRMEVQSNEEIHQDMAEIAERLGPDKILFVTHVNAITQESGIIAERDRVIRAVHKGAEILGVPSFEPTAAMFEVGQSVAMEREGTDLTHFTLAFSDFIFHQIHQQHLAPKFGKRIEPPDDNYPERIEQQILATKISALLDRDPAAAECQLADALAENPLSQPLAEMSGRLALKKGETDEAVAVLTPLEDAGALTIDGRCQLLQALVQSKRWAHALETFNNLLGDEYEESDILCLGAQANESLGEHGQALSLRMRAFRTDRTQLTAALSALAFLKDSSQGDRASAWQAEIIANARLDSQKAGELRLWAVANGDQALLLHALDHENPVEAVDSIINLVETGQYEDAAAAFRRVFYRASSDADGKTADALTKLVEAMRSKADTAYASDQYRQGYVLAEAVKDATGERDSKIARAAKRQFELKWRDMIVANDHAAAVAFVETAPELAMSIERRVQRWSMALRELGRHEEALEIARQSRDRFPENAAIVRWLGRLAAIQGNYELALPNYEALRSAGLADADKYAAETERFFDTLERKALSQIAKADNLDTFKVAVSLSAAIAPYVADAGVLADAHQRLTRKILKNARELEGEASDHKHLEGHWRLALALEPDHPRTLRRLAVLLTRNRKFAEAARLWARVIDKNDDDKAASRNLERCKKMAGRVAKALDAV